MKKVLELFTLDWKRIFKNPLTTMLMVALLILPALYCWFNVWALWDPYSNTADLKIAVYSDDSGTKFQDQKIEVGSELTAQLKKNKTLGWTFVNDKHDLVEGVKSGKYYAGIYVPKNFSKDLLTFINGEITKPKLEYYVNTKINAVAPKITDKGASTIQDQISDQFVTVVGKTLVGVFNKLGIDLNNNLPMLRKFTALLTTTNDNLPVIEQYLAEVTTVNQKMPEIESKLNEVNEMMTFIPAINQFSAKLNKDNSYLPLVEDAGRLSVELNQNTETIYNAAGLLNKADQNFDQAASALNSGIETLDKSSQFVDTLTKDLPDITQFSHSLEDFTNYTKNELIPTVQSVLPVIKSTLHSSLNLVIQLLSDLNQALTTLSNYLNTHELTDADKDKIRDALNTIKDINTDLAATNKSIANMLTKLADSLTDSLSNDQLAKLQQDLYAAATKFNNLANLSIINNGMIDTFLDDLDQLSTADIQARLNQIINANKTLIDNANKLINSTLFDQIDNFITQLSSVLDKASSTLSDLNTDILPNVPELLSSTKSTLTQLSSLLKKVQTDIPTIKATLHNSNSLVQENLGTVTNGISTLSSLYLNEYPSLKLKLTRIEQLANTELPRIESELTSAVDLANAKLPEVKNGLSLAQDFIDNDWADLKAGIQKGAAAINSIKGKVDLDQLINLLKRDANKESNFLANPVELETKTLYPIPTYGSQSAPFYTALCIWVGALLLSSVFSTDFVLDEKQKEKYSKRQQYFARYLTFLAIGLMQALIVSMGNMFLIHTYVKDPVWFVVTTMFIAFSFFSVLYPFVALFGNVGKGIGIIILVLSISGAGGNFPVILSGQFFQTINPFLPFTYAVNALRETVGGIYWANFQTDWIFLAGVGLAILILGAVLMPVIKPFTDKIHEQAKKGLIIHW